MYDPDLYAQSNEIPKRDALLCLENFAPPLRWKLNNRVIDIGCGDGSVTAILKNFLPSDYKLVGCDISENMVKFAAKHHSNEKTSFSVLDIAGELPEDMKGSFDHVFSFYVLNWVANQKRALENIFNLLDQDGECFMTLAANHPFYDVYRILSNNNKWRTWMHDVEKHISPYHDSNVPAKEIMELMESIGFENINVKCKDLFYVYTDEEIIRKHTAAVNPFKIPKERINEFIDDYIKSLRLVEWSHNRTSYTGSKDVTLYYKLLIVYGRKPSKKLSLERNKLD